MPRAASAIMQANSAQVFALANTERIIRMRKIVVYCTVNITGTLQLKVGYQGGTGAELVTNVTITATTAGQTQTLTLATSSVPANSTIIVTPTAGTGGSYQVLYTWDADH